MVRRQYHVVKRWTCVTDQSKVRSGQLLGIQAAQLRCRVKHSRKIQHFSANKSKMEEPARDEEVCCNDHRTGPAWLW